jgi:hypothetical protein
MINAKSFILFFLQLLFLNSFLAQVAPFFTPAVSNGIVAVRLYPMENVSAGVSTIVTYECRLQEVLFLGRLIVLDY